jgi:hypothetical protein
MRRDVAVSRAASGAAAGGRCALRRCPTAPLTESYVIAPDGKIVSHYMSLNLNKHVEKMLDALRGKRRLCCEIGRALPDVERGVRWNGERQQDSGTCKDLFHGDLLSVTACRVRIAIV